MMLKKSLGLALALMLLMSAAPMLGAELEYLSYQDALKKAETENKKVMIFFWTEWCPWCTKARTEVFSDPKIKKEFNKNFIAVSVNAEKDPEKLAVKYSASALPTLTFVDSKGEVLGFWPGFADQETFLKVLQHINSLKAEKQT